MTFTFRDPETEITKKQFLDFITSLGSFSKSEIKLIDRACDFGAEAHKGQKRKSGADYFRCHCLHVASYLADFQADTHMIVAGLLHDTLEDTPVTAAGLRAEFDEDIVFLIESVSNLGIIKYKYYDRHVSSLRRFFITIAKDVRVVIIKLFDRIHNLQTLKHLPPAKQKRIAQESILIHGQLAERLNMTNLQSLINDAAFQFAYKKEYLKMKKLKKINPKYLEKSIDSIKKSTLNILSPELGYTPSVTGRVKNLYSLYRKLVLNDWQIDAIYDIIAIRIIVKNKVDCYKVLGLLHDRWRPFHKRFRDYISNPLKNGYRSLHTTLFIGDGNIIEFQIRDEAMHQHSEYGSAAHLKYKYKTKIDGETKPSFDWLGDLSLISNDQQSSSEYLKQLRTDFFFDRIFVFTPKGDVIDLPKKAIALDFAFAIHTDLGVYAKGAMINGVYKSLRTVLKNQDVVNIITDKRNVKNKDNYLKYLATNIAKKKILDQADSQKK